MKPRSLFVGAIPHLAMSALLFSPCLLPDAGAQPRPDQNIAQTSIEVLAETVNGELRCRPPTLRLPSREPVAFKVITQTDRPVSFAAPEFFRRADHIESEGFVLDVMIGGFTVAPRSVAEVTLRTPSVGRYSYSCFEPGQVPNTQTSGFLDVVPAAGETGTIR